MMEATQNMFGLLASGRLVRTDFVQIDATHFTITICDVDSLNHIAVFLTGSIPFPEGMAGLVYYNSAKSGVENEWQLLGSISNTKPSAIFRISHTKKSEEINGLIFQSLVEPGNNYIARVGISIESTDMVEQQTVQLLNGSFSNPVLASDFAKRMLVSFYNYASSFAAPPSELKQNTNYIPLNILQNWYQSFERKLSLNPNFWKTN